MRFAAALCISWFAAGAALGAVRPSPPEVSARAHVLVDYRSGALLASNNPDERHEPASLTKMMSTYVVFAELREGNIRLDDMVLVSEKAWRAPGSRMFIEVGDRVSVEQLLLGVIIQSGNDASIALAEHVAGHESAFADLMNRHAERLGMHDSNFTNASGLPDPDLYTTPRDMATVARALIREFPDYYQWHAVKSFEYNGIEQKNRNRLLWQDESVDGLKTGYTRSAGYCLVASAARGDMRLVSVVMGSPSAKIRTRATAALLGFGFRAYEARRVYGADEVVAKLQVWKGESPELRLGLAEDLFLTISRGDHERLATIVETEETNIAPVARGAVRGTLRVQLDNEVLAERPLVALHSVELGSLWQRLGDSIRLLFR